MGSALPKDMKKGSGLIDCGIRIAEFKIKKKKPGPGVPPFALKASDSAKASTGQDGGQARAQVSGVRCRVYCSKLKAQRLIGEKANRLEGYKA